MSNTRVGTRGYESVVWPGLQHHGNHEEGTESYIGGPFSIREDGAGPMDGLRSVRRNELLMELARARVEELCAVMSEEDAWEEVEEEMKRCNRKHAALKDLQASTEE